MAHIILVTKYRKQLLFGEFREDLKQYLFDTCVRYHWYIKRMETDRDHVHILLQYNPTDSITRIVATLKQHSTYHAWGHYSRMLRHAALSHQTFEPGLKIVSGLNLELLSAFIKLYKHIFTSQKKFIDRHIKYIRNLFGE